MEKNHNNQTLGDIMSIREIVLKSILAVIIGFILGMIGNYLEHCSLIIFPLLGFGISKLMHKEFFYLWKHLVFSISVTIGIFASGFMFFSDAFLVEWLFWLKIVYIFGGALLFFLGYNSRELYHWQQERKWASRMG